MADVAYAPQILIEPQDPLAAGLIASKPLGFPHLAVSPMFYADDPGARVAGRLLGSGRPGLVVKPMDGWTSIYSAAMHLPPALIRNIVRAAGVHVWIETDDAIYADNQFADLLRPYHRRCQQNYPGHRCRSRQCQWIRQSQERGNWYRYLFVQRDWLSDLLHRSAGTHLRRHNLAGDSHRDCQTKRCGYRPDSSTERFRLRGFLQLLGAACRNLVQLRSGHSNAIRRSSLDDAHHYSVDG